METGDENNFNSLKTILIVWIYIKVFLAKKKINDVIFHL